MYKKVLVPVDGSEIAECVFPHVEAIVKGCNVPQLIFVRIVEPVIIPVGDAEYFSSEIWTQVEQHEKTAANNYMKQLATKIKYDNTNIEYKILEGRTADSIIEFATKNKVDLIIIATHGRSGISRFVRGSVANRVLQSARIPVLIVPAAGCKA